VVHAAAGEERAEDSLLEHLVAHVGTRPRAPDHVLVQVLSRPEPECEAAVGEQAAVAAFWATTTGW